MPEKLEASAIEYRSRTKGCVAKTSTVGIPFFASRTDAASLSRPMASTIISPGLPQRRERSKCLHKEAKRAELTLLLNDSEEPDLSRIRCQPLNLRSLATMHSHQKISSSAYGNASPCSDATSANKLKP